MKQTCHHVVASAAALAVSTPLLLGGGFQLAERSASGLGRAFSGEAAIGDDASIVGSNPAGMMLLRDDFEFSVGGSAILPDSDVSGTAFLIPPPGGGGPRPVTASDSGFATDAFVPFLYAAYRPMDNLAIGLGVLTRYGLEIDYSSSFAARAATDLSELVSVSINPSVAYRLNKQWSVGAGIDATYADATLTASLPIGAAPAPQALDLEGDDWGYGFNVGILYEHSESTRFGLHYRSEVEFDLKGRGFNFGEGVFAPVSAEAGLTLPDTIEFSAYHELNSRWAVHGDILWTDWSDFEDLTATYAGGTLLSNYEGWKDVFRVAAGVTYKHDDKWTFRAGAAWDESPIPDAQRRTLRIPVGDRIWIAAGLTYRINACYTLDVGYTHILQNDVRINEPAFDNGSFVGEAEGSVNIVAIGLNGAF